MQGPNIGVSQCRAFRLQRTSTTEHKRYISTKYDIPMLTRAVCLSQLAAHTCVQGSVLRLSRPPSAISTHSAMVDEIKLPKSPPASQEVQIVVWSGCLCMARRIRRGADDRLQASVDVC